MNPLTVKSALASAGPQDEVLIRGPAFLQHAEATCDLLERDARPEFQPAHPLAIQDEGKILRVLYALVHNSSGIGKTILYDIEAQRVVRPEEAVEGGCKVGQGRAADIVILGKEHVALPGREERHQHLAHLTPHGI